MSDESEKPERYFSQKEIDTLHEELYKYGRSNTYLNTNYEFENAMNELKKVHDTDYDLQSDFNLNNKTMENKFNQYDKENIFKNPGLKRKESTVKFGTKKYSGTYQGERTLSTSFTKGKKHGFGIEEWKDDDNDEKVFQGKYKYGEKVSGKLSRYELSKNSAGHEVEKEKDTFTGKFKNNLPTDEGYYKKNWKDEHGKHYFRGSYDADGNLNEGTLESITPDDKASTNFVGKFKNNVPDTGYYETKIKPNENNYIEVYGQKLKNNKTLATVESTDIFKTDKKVRKETHKVNGIFKTDKENDPYSLKLFSEGDYSHLEKGVIDTYSQDMRKDSTGYYSLDGERVTNHGKVVKNGKHKLMFEKNDEQKKIQYVNTNDEPNFNTVIHQVPNDNENDKQFFAGKTEQFGQDIFPQIQQDNFFIGTKHYIKNDSDDTNIPLSHEEQQIEKTGDYTIYQNLGNEAKNSVSDSIQKTMEAASAFDL